MAAGVATATPVCRFRLTTLEVTLNEERYILFAKNQWNEPELRKCGVFKGCYLPADRMGL